MKDPNYDPDDNLATKVIVASFVSLIVVVVAVVFIGWLVRGAFGADY